MRSSVTSTAWLLPVLASMALLQACDHKDKTPAPQTLAPPIVDTPPPQAPSVSTATLPPPQVVPPTQPADNTPPKPADQPKKPARHSRKPVASNSQPAQEPAVDPSSSTVSSIGDLSGVSSGDRRTETEQTINATEKGLNGITRHLNDNETKTAAQIREFLKHARSALNSGDVEGALTLARKAKVLLAEINP